MAPSVDISAAVSADQLKAMVDRIVDPQNLLISGAPLQDWWARQAGELQHKIQTAVQMGLLQGKSIDEIKSDLRVFIKPAPIRGVAPTDSQYAAQLAAVARTAVATTQSKSQLEYLRQNADLFSGIRWVSVLDSRTTLQCQFYDGKVWSLPTDLESMDDDEARAIHPKTLKELDPATLETKKPDPEKQQEVVSFPGFPPIHWNAVIEGTLVRMDEGETPIEKILPGDLVLTGRGRFRPVYTVMQKEVDKDSTTFRLITASGNVLHATGEHPILTADGWRRADELKVGDSICEFCAAEEGNVSAILASILVWDAHDQPCEVNETFTPDLALYGSVGVISPSKPDVALMGVMDVAHVFQVGRVAEIQTEEYRGTVWNLAVLEDESFIAGDIIVHNCRSTTVPVLKSWEQLAGKKLPHQDDQTVQEIFEQKIKDQHFEATQGYHYVDKETGEKKIKPILSRGGGTRRDPATGKLIRGRGKKRSAYLARKEISEAIEEATADQRASVDGAVPAKLTYPEWFAAQPAADQRLILGPVRYQMWQDGLFPLEGFVSDGRPLSVTELKQAIIDGNKIPKGQQEPEGADGLALSERRILEAQSAATLQSTPEYKSTWLAPDTGVTVNQSTTHTLTQEQSDALVGHDNLVHLSNSLANKEFWDLSEMKLWAGVPGFSGAKLVLPSGQVAIVNLKASQTWTTADAEKFDRIFKSAMRTTKSRRKPYQRVDPTTAVRKAFAAVGKMTFALSKIGSVEPDPKALATMYPDGSDD